MEETTFRIMDTLSRELGNPTSISKLTERVKKLHGTAYYANIYRALQNLTREGAITLTKTGNTSIANLNFRNYLLLDLLTEMELRRKHELLKSHELQILLMDLDAQLRNMRRIESISLINPEQSLRLNRLEFLILLDRDLKDSDRLDYTITLYQIMRELQNKHNTKIDPLILTFTEFLELLESDEINPLREMLPYAITIYSPSAFWYEIGMSSRKIHGIPIGAKQTISARIGERDLIHNLARFGYREMGPEIKKGTDICIENIITSLLLEKDARHTEAIPILLAKNKANYNLLTFLSQKYGLEGELLGILRALNSIKPSEESQAATRIFEAMKITEIRADEDSMREKMRLYTAA
jgi:hypothetical protein